MKQQGVLLASLLLSFFLHQEITTGEEEIPPEIAVCWTAEEGFLFFAMKLNKYLVSWTISFNWMFG